MKRILAALLWLALFFTLSVTARGEQCLPAGYLSPGAPAFDLTISQFRERFNHANPDLPLTPFRALAASDSAPLLRAASPIDDRLYASTALERGTLKIKSMQITWLMDEHGDNAIPDNARAYMSALMRFFSPVLSQQQSRQQLDTLLKQAHIHPCYSQTDGAVRYVLATDADRTLTFAVEPIKLTLSGGTQR